MKRIRKAYSAALDANLEKLVTIGPSSPHSTRLELVTGSVKKPNSFHNSLSLSPKVNYFLVKGIIMI